MDVEVRQIDQVKGKGLFAKRKFCSGEVILEEDPLVCGQFLWNAAYGYRGCDHCLRPLESAQENASRLTSNPNLILPYPQCCTTDKETVIFCQSCGTEYCSSECQAKAFNQYHRSLCHQSDGNHPLDKLAEAWKHVHYPPETSTIMLIPRLLATIQQSPNPEETRIKILQFSHRTLNEDSELVHKMLGEKFAGQLSMLHALLLQAVSHHGVEDLLTVEGFQMLLAIIGTNGQGVGTSAISQWVMKSSDLPLEASEKEQLDGFIDKLYENMDQVVGNFLNNEGVGLFALHSMCNHSCVPNAEAAFQHNNSRLSLLALRDIEPGEEIFISYLDECDSGRSRHSRQKILAENYVFVCKCLKCEEQAQDVDVTSEEEEEIDD